MLQFLTHKSDRYTVLEEAQMAIEGGCRWIEVTASADEGSTVKETLELLKPLCEENEAFLMVDGDVNIANDFRIHGVHLSKSDMSPREARELLGPHAVIGVDVENLDDILALKGIDVDYAVLYPFGERLSVDDYRSTIARARLAAVDLPIVARGNIGLSDIVELRKAGVNGIALWKPILDGEDPVATTHEVIDLLASVE